MTVDPPSEQRLRTKPLGFLEGKPIGTATGRYTALQQAQAAVLAPTPGKEQKPTRDVADFVGDESPRSAQSVEQESQPFSLEGSAQVPVVPCETHGTHELPCVSQGSLAGVSPHAPDPPRRERRKLRSRARKNFTVRMSNEMREKLEAKAVSVETYPSAHVLELIAADLSLPVDDYRATRNKQLKLAYADLRRAFDDCGVNLNQMAKATNSGKPCPLTRSEIDEALKKFKTGCATLEGLRP